MRRSIQADPTTFLTVAACDHHCFITKYCCRITHVYHITSETEGQGGHAPRGELMTRGPRVVALLMLLVELSACANVTAYQTTVHDPTLVADARPSRPANVYIVVFDDEVTDLSIRALTRKLDQRPIDQPTVVALRSQGGRIGSAVVGAEAIRKAEAVTYVPPEARCDSACNLLFAAGRQRLVAATASLTFHGGFFGSTPDQPSCRYILEVFHQIDPDFGNFLSQHSDRFITKTGIRLRGQELAASFPHFVIVDSGLVTALR